MSQALIIIGVIVLFFIVAALVEDRRQKVLRAWVESHPGAKLHWGFDPAQFPQFPAVDLSTRLIGRAPPKWGGVLETESVWFAEMSFSRTASETSKWHVMVARRAADGSWQTELKEGLMTKDLLDKAMQ